MKTIVLAAGYATRLYPLTENFPKPLLEVGGMSILDRLIKDTDAIEDIESHLIVSNHRYFPHFEKWVNDSRYTKKITLMDDGTTDNDNRLGAVRDLLLAVKTFQLVDDDLLVIAADNVVNFSFQGFIDYFKEKQTSLVMTCYEPEISALRRTGVIFKDQDNKVLEMEEKPENPKSHFAVPPFYIYKKSDVKFFESCLSEGCHPDAPGNLVRYMLTKTVIHAWPMTGKRYDVGTIQSYDRIKDAFQTGM